MNTETAVTYLGCIILLFVIGKVFMMPIIKILKLIANSILGALLIYCINFIGNFFSFHIGLNYITAIITGLLGIPGAVLLILLKIFL